MSTKALAGASFVVSLAALMIAAFTFASTRTSDTTSEEAADGDFSGPAGALNDTGMQMSAYDLGDNSQPYSRVGLGGLDIDPSNYRFAPPKYVVQGNRLVDAPTGKPVRAIGVNRAGTEYACIQGWGIFDGASDRAFVQTMKSWGINTVRVTVNEHCWLGRNGAPASFSGEIYRDALAQWVDLLHDEGLGIVLSLIWVNAGDERAIDQERMPNRDHSIDFWRSAAETFKGDEAMMFQLFGEPHDVGWECWRNGCDLADGYPAAGMQELVDAIRSTGATQPIIVNGIAYGNDMSEFLVHKPVDPADAMVAGFHVYNWTPCATRECWDSTILPIAAQYPVVTTELGENTCSSEFTTDYMRWADEHAISYIGWSFNAWGDCAGGPDLISAEDGTPTPFGAGFRDHILTTGAS